MSLFAIATPAFPGVFTYRGAIIVHENRAELEFLFPGRTARDVTGTDAPIIPLENHPDMAGISWPLRREDFR